jgi:hypothetical protein
MSFTEQSRRLLPGAEEKLSANAYLGLTALTGLIGWVPTVYVIHFMSSTPSGTVGMAEAGPWMRVVTQHSWTLMGLWAVLSVGLVAIGILRVERAAVLSTPQLLWTVGVVISLVLNTVGVMDHTVVLVWAPWLVLFAVVYSLYAYVVTTGALVIDPAAEGEMAGAVLLPFPYTYLVIGLLHVVPVAVDAALGGRQMTDAGIPKVKADYLENEDGSDGVVPD